MRKKLLISICLFLFLILTGWVLIKNTKKAQKPALLIEASSISIPPNLSPIKVVKNIYASTPAIAWIPMVTGAEIKPSEISAPGFIEGYCGCFVDTKNPEFRGPFYITKNDEEIKPLFADDPHMTLDWILQICISKYENSDFAKQEYNRKSKIENFKDFSFKGIKLKVKDGLPDDFMKSLESYKGEKERGLWSPQEIQRCREQFKKVWNQYTQYLLLSNNYVIFIYGLKKATEDTLERLIDCYGVKK